VRRQVWILGYWVLGDKCGFEIYCVCGDRCVLVDYCVWETVYMSQFIVCG